MKQRGSRAKSRAQSQTTVTAFFFFCLSSGRLPRLWILLATRPISNQSRKINGASRWRIMRIRQSLANIDSTIRLHYKQLLFCCVEPPACKFFSRYIQILSPTDRVEISIRKSLFNSSRLRAETSLSLPTAWEMQPPISTSWLKLFFYLQNIGLVSLENEHQIVVDSSRSKFLSFNSLFHKIHTFDNMGEMVHPPKNLARDCDRPRWQKKHAENDQQDGRKICWEWSTICRKICWECFNMEVKICCKNLFRTPPWHHHLHTSAFQSSNRSSHSSGFYSCHQPEMARIPKEIAEWSSTEKKGQDTSILCYNQGQKVYSHNFGFIMTGIN